MRSYQSTLKASDSAVQRWDASPGAASGFHVTLDGGVVSSAPPMSESLEPSGDPSEISGRMAGEYRLGRKLGEGGFGAVYEAQHPVLKRKAAVKVLHRAAGMDSDAVLRFISEAQAVNQVRSRHIVDVFSFGRLPDGRHFYVMDLLDGEPLDRFLERVGRVEVATAMQILRPIATALDTAHAAGIVHRDLKPQNIFLAWDATGETVPKLLDFGMAKLLGDSTVHTVSGTPVGTPLYMSPEQARGEKVDGRSDVYAFGALCHEMLTGHPPIGGDTTIAVLMAQIIQDPPRVSEVAPDLSPELDAPVLAMLQKKPEARPATAGEALSTLERAAEAGGYQLRPGLPQLERPAPTAPPPMSAVPPSLRSEVGRRTTEVDPSFVSLESRTRERSRSWTWPAVLALLMLLGAGLYLVLAERGSASNAIGTPAATPSAASSSGSNSAAAMLPAAAPAPSASGSSADPASPAPSSSAGKAVKRAPANAPRSAIPRDLESPF